MIVLLLDVFCVWKLDCGWLDVVGCGWMWLWMHTCLNGARSFDSKLICLTFVCLQISFQVTVELTPHFLAELPF